MMFEDGSRPDGPRVVAGPVDARNAIRRLDRRCEVSKYKGLRIHVTEPVVSCKDGMRGRQLVIDPRVYAISIESIRCSDKVVINVARSQPALVRRRVVGE